MLKYKFYKHTNKVQILKQNKIHRKKQNVGKLF